jgi:O-antigen ligase
MGAAAELRAPVPGSRFPAVLVAVGLLILVTAVIVNRAVAPAAGALLILSALAVGYKVRVRWDVVIAFILLVVLVVPIKRYAFAVNLPLDLELYRIVIAILLGIWVTALLVDPSVRLRSSGLDGPLMLIAFSVIASIAMNPEWVTSFNVFRSYVGSDYAGLVRDVDRLPLVDVSSTVTKSLLFFTSFYLVFYFILSVVRSPREIHAVIKSLVAGAAGVALFAIIERRTYYNVFDHLEGWIPIIQFEGGLEEEGIARGGRLRVYASAQHPIALAVLFAMVLPLSAYLAVQTRKAIWYLSSALLTLAALATVSRTGVVVLATIGVVFFVLRRDALRRLWVILLPAAIVVHLLMPGTIGSLRASFFPQGGLVADQTKFSGRASSERVGPAFDAVKANPAFGQGFGTRITSGPQQNSRVLDNQWLATAVEMGLVGVFAWVWLFVRFLRRAGRVALHDPGGRGWLLTALASSVAGFSVALFTYDAFSFIQAVLVFFVLLALGASTLAHEGEWESP